MQTQNNLTFNPLDKRLFDNPFPVLKELRDADPVFFEASLGLYVVTGYEECMTVLNHPDGDCRFIEMQKLRMGGDVEAQPYCKGMREFLLMKEGEDHGRIRGAFGRHFTPKRVATMHQEMTNRAHSLIDGFEKSGKAELLEAFAKPLPLSVISDLLDVPPEDNHRIEELIEGFKVAIQYLPMNEEQLKQANTGIAGLSDYFSNLIAERRVHPGNDLLTEMITEADAGALTHEELVANAWGLYAAGHETTASAICNGVILLLNNPDQLELLLNDWSLVDNAAEEVLRTNGPGQAGTRTFPKDIQVGEHTIPANSPVIIFYPGGNRDPSRWSEPDRFDIRRKEVKNHLGFGNGVHRCAGQHLARATISIALKTLFSRLSGLKIAGDFGWNQLSIFRGPTSLPVAWDGVHTRN